MIAYANNKFRANVRTILSYLFIFFTSYLDNCLLKYGAKIKPVVSAFIRYHIQMIILIKKQVMIFFLLEITPNLPKKMKFKLKKNHNLVSLKDKNILFASINS